MKLFTVVWLAAVLGAFSAGCAAPSTRICDPGRVVSCPCAGDTSREGTQTCREDGTGFEICLGCGAPDGGVGDGATTDGARADAPVGGACAYPALHGTVMPTPGRCEGNVAITCDHDSQQLVPVTCGTDERCVEVDVEQVELPSAEQPIPAQHFRWASCVPVDAATCDYAWSSASSAWLPSDGFSRCADATHEVRCAMPLPALPLFPFNAGTVTGVERRIPCTSSDLCRENRCVAGDAPCATARSWCEGDDWLTCDAGAYATRVPCGDMECRSTTVCAGAESAACFPTAYLDPASRCDPARFSGGCGVAGGVLACGDSGISCYDEGGQCRCSVSELPCFDRNECRAVGSGASTRHECLPIGVSCDAGDRCEGQTAVRCDAEGRPALFDCSSQGMTCTSAGGRVGCVAGTETCDPVTTAPLCTSQVALEGCCQSDGTFFAGPRTLPCLAGRRVVFTCPSVPGAPAYTCTTGLCGVS